MIRTLLFGLTYIALISLDSITAGQTQYQTQYQWQCLVEPEFYPHALALVLMPKPGCLPNSA
jgi:hypothetical protein